MIRSVTRRGWALPALVVCGFVAGCGGDGPTGSGGNGPEDFHPTADVDIAGALELASLVIPTGVTVTATDAATLRVAGTIEIAGVLVGDCVALTVEGASTVSVTGRVSNACSTLPADVDPPALTVGSAGAVTLDGAVVESSGDVLLRDDPALTVGAMDPGAAPAPDDRRLVLRGSTLRHLPETALAGAAGTSTGGDGRDGGGWTILSRGTLVLDGSTVVAQNGGAGGAANMEGEGELSAAGGAGGHGGAIVIGGKGAVEVTEEPAATAVATDRARSMQGTILDPGDGGDGGAVRVDISYTFGGSGPAATGRGGDAGVHGSTAVITPGLLGGLGLAAHMFTLGKPGSVTIVVPVGPDATAEFPVPPPPTVTATTGGFRPDPAGDLGIVTPFDLPVEEFGKWVDGLEGRAARATVDVGAPGRPSAEHPDGHGGPNIELDLSNTRLAGLYPTLGVEHAFLPQFTVRVGAPPAGFDGCGGSTITVGGAGFSAGRLDVTVPGFPVFDPDAPRPWGFEGMSAGNGGSGQPPGPPGSPLDLTLHEIATGRIFTLDDLLAAVMGGPAGSGDLNGDGAAEFELLGPSFGIGVSGGPCFSGELKAEWSTIREGQLPAGTEGTLPLLDSEGTQQGSLTFFVPDGGVFHQASPRMMFVDPTGTVQLGNFGGFAPIQDFVFDIGTISRNHGAGCPFEIRTFDPSGAQVHEFIITDFRANTTRTLDLEGKPFERMDWTIDSPTCPASGFVGVREFRFSVGFRF